MPDTTPPIRVLHLEDSLRDAEIVRDTLESDGPACDVVHVDSRARFESALADGAFDVIICDFNLPDLDGLTALRLAKDQRPETPVVMVSGAIDPAEAAECLKRGATDYVLKQRLERLPFAVKRAIDETAQRRRRQEIQAKLRESEERFRLLAEQSSDGFWFIGLNPERILYVSPATEKIWGLSAERFHQDARVWLGVVHADDQARMREVRKISAKGERFEEECRVVRPDGSVRWVLNSGTPIRDEAGAITGLSGLTQDITDRKQAEEALRESEHRYRALADSGQALIWSADTDKLCHYVNRALLAFTGRTMEQEQGNGWAEGVHPDDLQRCLAVYLGAFDRRETFSMDYRLRRHDGEYRWIQDDGCPRYSASGEFVGYIGYCLDITERKQAEEALRQSEAFSRAVLNSLTYHIAVLDAQGTIVATNLAWQVFARENGGNQQTIHPIGTNYFSVVQHSIDHGDAIAQAALDGIRAVLSGARDTFALEYPCHSPDKPRWFVLRVQPRSDEHGGVVIAHQDITERMELEAQFRQVQKMESVGRLAGGIAHDFNNLLTVINGTTELALLDMGDADALRMDLDEIRLAGERAAALTRQLLAFSRKQILQLQVLNLNTVVAGMKGMLGRLIGEDVHLVFVLSDGLGSVRADVGQMEQVVVNLVVNARDAMPQGGTLTIETRNDQIDERRSREHGLAAPAGPHVILAVADTGMGMDEVTRRQIFEPFFTTKGSGRGTGLGLSTVYGIIKQSNGLIFAESEVGRGTRFEVCLPQVSETALGHQPRPTVTSTSGTETILLVEDNGGLRKLARRILESAGYHVLDAASGEEALLVLGRRREAPVHLLLTDVVMPGMNGRVLSERVGEVRSGMKVLYTSGYTDDAIVHHGILDEGTAFVSKPFTPADLLRKVREVLDSQ